MQGEARYSFNVSTTAEVIKLVSGHGFKGAVDYVVSDSDGLNQSIGVEITLSAPAKDEEIETPSDVSLRWLPLKDRLNRKHPEAYVCSIPTHENEIKGIVLSVSRLSTSVTSSLAKPIFTFQRGPPDHHHRDHHNRYYPPFYLPLLRPYDDVTPYVTAKVLVTIPRGHIELGSFSSVFVGLTQNINGAFDEVVFKRLFICGATSGLPNIEVGHASINAGASPINGSFIVKDYLELITTKAPIDVDVTLLSNATARYPTRLSLLNFNGSIDADVKLVVYSSTADAKSNGSFAINALTTRAPVDVNITSLPSNAFLGLRAANRLAPVTASVPPSYEGGLVLVTTKGDSVVKVNKDTPDPEDKGRKRELNVRYIGGRIVAGSVKWVKSEKGAVAVEAKASKNNDDDALDERKKHGPSEEGRDDSWEDPEDMILDRSKIDLVSTNANVVLDLN